MRQSSRRTILQTAAVGLATLPLTRAIGFTGRGQMSNLNSSGGADMPLAQLFPEAVTIDSSGLERHLPPDKVSPEAFGAVGDGVTNDRTAIQKAIDYAAAIGARSVQFNKAAYAIWAPARTSDPAIKNAEDGHPIVVRRTVALLGRKDGRTVLRFRNVDGQSFETAWQVVNGKVWRGGGIYLQGLMPDDQSGAVPPSITLSDLVLDGGCPMGEVFQFPARLADGDGWDVTHKGLWSEEDRRTGDWNIQRCTVTRFRGELIYQGGDYHGAITMRNVEFSHTNADILNPCGTNLDVEHGYFHHGYAMWEGWGGRNGRIIDSLFEECRHGGGIQGGKAYTHTHEKGAFTRPTTFEPGVKPWLTLDIRIVNCGPVYIGSWVRGRIDMTDSVLAISTNVFHNILDVDIDLLAKCRLKSLPAALSITGGPPGQNLLKDVTVRVIIEEDGILRYGKPMAEQGDTSSAQVIIQAPS